MAAPPPFMPWDPRYDSGIPEVDRQHRTLVDLLNRAAACVEEGRNWEVETLFNDLWAYADHHFAFEEGLLEQARYPDLDAHKREHQAFRNHLANLYAGYLSRTGGGAAELMGFLRAWLETHILTSDRAYVPFVLEATGS